jgi:hypothetical protein
MEKLICQYLYRVTEHRHDWANLARLVAAEHTRPAEASPAASVENAR